MQFLSQKTWTAWDFWCIHDLRIFFPKWFFQFIYLFTSNAWECPFHHTIPRSEKSYLKKFLKFSVSLFHISLISDCLFYNWKAAVVLRSWIGSLCTLPINHLDLTIFLNTLWVFIYLFLICWKYLFSVSCLPLVFFDTQKN